jgi:hypothetical protein
MHDITEYAIEVNGDVIDVAFRDKDKAREYREEWLEYCDDPENTTVTIVHRRVTYGSWFGTTP